MKKDIIKSFYYSQDELIQGIMNLYKIEQFDLDPTYSKGNFYKKIIEPKYKSDINPQYADVLGASSTILPFKKDIFSSIIFDPPFLATTGKSLSQNNDSNIIAKRFTVFKNETELHEYYKNSLIEFYRILKKEGILVFKCQDKVSSGTQYMSHVYIINEAEKIGFYTKDLFLLLAKNRITPEWQIKNQQHARKFHSYFLVFQKINKKCKY